MEHHRSLFIKKSHWERLKDQASPLNSDEKVTSFREKQEYYNQLDEQSKAWKKNWPDTVEGFLAKVNARKERQHQKEVLFVKKIEEQKKKKLSDRSKAVAEAKQKIFYTSCYGQQLISAVRESKDIEERHAQIEFQKLINKEEIEYDNAIETQIASMENNLYDFAKRDEEANKKRKQLDKEQATINKMIHEYEEYEKAKSKQEEILRELENEKWQRMNLEYENHAKDLCKEKIKEECRQHDADQKAIRGEKLLREQENDALTDVWSRNHDRVRCMEKRTWEKIIKERGESSENYKKSYELTNEALSANKEAYEKFVEKGIQALEKRESKNEESNMSKQKISHEVHHKQALEDYIRALDIKDIMKRCKSYRCDKQSLFTKSCSEKRKKTIEKDDSDTYKPESFLTPYNKLTADLEKRRKEKPPWTALQAEHQYFAQEAAKTINECKHKLVAKKVVQEYKKTHCLNSATPCIPDD